MRSLMSVRFGASSGYAERKRSTMARVAELEASGTRSARVGTETMPLMLPRIIAFVRWSLMDARGWRCGSRRFLGLFSPAGSQLDQQNHEECAVHVHPNL